MVLAVFQVGPQTGIPCISTINFSENRTAICCSLSLDTIDEMHVNQDKNT